MLVVKVDYSIRAQNHIYIGCESFPPWSRSFAIVCKDITVKAAISVLVIVSGGEDKLQHQAQSEEEHQ